MYEVNFRPAGRSLLQIMQEWKVNDWHMAKSQGHSLLLGIRKEGNERLGGWWGRLKVMGFGGVVSEPLQTKAMCRLQLWGRGKNEEGGKTGCWWDRRRRERETVEMKVEIERQKEKADRERNQDRQKWPGLPRTMDFLVYLSSMCPCIESCLFPEILWAGLCSHQKAWLKWMDWKELYF